ncbi:HNH endonuclease [Fibrella aquatilis]|uniref:HNH endonuclease n=1 Tax=Fibrella aquatilis TaxID=2817059 RepID=A0A939JY96_9BACT|nr:HNH endonuclease [Fibrella aquatilis]MBO0930128.1 HNH endonuclease [Fibrella aquatilis]
MTPPHAPRLAHYVRQFSRLKQGGTKYGKAPHKPVLLLTITELLEKGLITDNRVGVTPELVATFKENFVLLAKAGHNDDFTQPFFYLKNEGFWFLQPKPGYQIDLYIRSVNTLSERLDYAHFADDLYGLLTDTYSRIALKNTLLDTYFPARKAEFLRVKNAGRSYLGDLETYLLNEPTGTYQPAFTADDEETRFVRGGLFKRLVPQVYDFTCAISGMRVITTGGASLVEACHIVPISVSGNDHVSNGIALCSTLHTAFDRGMIGIDAQYRVLISPALTDNPASPYNLHQFAGQSLRPPHGQHHYPNREAFAWHLRERFKV